VGKLGIPGPALQLRPLLRFKDGRTGGVVGMPLWLWISQGTWSNRRAPRVSAGPVWVDLMAQPVQQVWSFGNGKSVTCSGRGTEYRTGMDAMRGSPDCGYKYTRTSKSEPNGAFTINVTVYWRITWVGSGNTAGELPLFASNSSIPYVVREARAELVAP
jgi:hypothetical protein